MYKKLVPLSSELHRNLKIKPLAGFAFAANMHLVPVLPSEAHEAAVFYPIIFVKSETGYQPMCLMSLSNGTNLFVNKNGKWAVSYIPAFIRRYPFMLVSAQDKPDQMVLCMDEASDLFSETEGQPLFTEQGEPVERIEQIKQFLLNCHADQQRGESLCTRIAEADLLTPLKLSVNPKDKEPVTVEGIYIVNEKALNELSDERFAELRKASALPFIYTHLISLGRIKQLLEVTRKANQTANSQVSTASVVPDRFNF